MNIGDKVRVIKEGRHMEGVVIPPNEKLKWHEDELMILANNTEWFFMPEDLELLPIFNVGDMVRVTGYTSLNGSTGTITHIRPGIHPIVVNWSDRSGEGYFDAEELSLVNNKELWV